MTVWFLIVLACGSPADTVTCHNDGPPIMTFETRLECGAVVAEALRLAALERKKVVYACEAGLAM